MVEMSSIEMIRLLAYSVKRQLAFQLEAEALGLVPMQVRVLKVIHKLDSCTALDIASFMQRDKAQVTRLISGLMQRGLIEKVPNSNDKRSQFLLLTAEGEKIQARFGELSKRTEQAMTSGIAEADMQSFLVVAQKIVKNLEEKS